MEQQYKTELLHLEGNLYANADGEVVMVDGIMDGTLSAEGYAKAKVVGHLTEEGYANAKGIKGFFDKLGNTKVGKAVRKGRDVQVKLLNKAGDTIPGKLLRKLRDTSLAAAFGVPRTAFIALVQKNFRGWATKMNDLKVKSEAGDKEGKEKWFKLFQVWDGFGGWIPGSHDKLKKAIETGSKKPIKLNKALKRTVEKRADGTIQSIEYETYHNSDGSFYNFVAEGVAAGTITAAAAIATAVAPIIGGIQEKKKADADIKKAQTENEAAEIDAAANREKNKKTFIIIGGIIGVLVLVGGIIMVIKSKKAKK